MALFNGFWTCIFFLLVSVIHVQAQSAGNSDCYVNNTRPLIPENNPPGLGVLNITTAPDVTVTIDSTSLNHNFFEINGKQLILIKSVDYEETAVLIVNLQCLRGGMEIADLLITVEVQNLNDNPPVFKETKITVSVNEDTKVHTVIVPQANVTATDEDGDVISYNLTGRPPEALNYFNIQGINNPQISLLQDLDYEKINFTELILYAMDGQANAPGTHTASATININVIPADLRPPWFQPCTFIPGGKLCISLGYTGKVNISEDTTEPLILQPGPLYAIDGDKYLNEKIVYYLVEGNDEDTFSVNDSTGNITMNKPVNIIKTFTLHVMAYQVNDPLKYAQTTVQIKVVYKNDHMPHFERSNYTGTVSVGLPVPSPVMESGTLSTPLKIFAADMDFPDEINPNIEYKIANSTDFSVTANGFLLTAKVLDLASTITLLAIAYDKEAQQETSTLIIVDVTPLTTTTIPPTTVITTTITSITTTTNAPVTTGTIISKPSSSSTHLPPDTSSSLPTIPPGSTTTTPPPPTTTTTTTTVAASVTPGLGTTVSKPSSSSTDSAPGANSSLPTTPPVSTTKTTGKPVTTTNPGSNIPPFVTTGKPPIITSNVSSQTTTSLVTGISQTTVGTETTKTSLPSASAATDGTGQATSTTSSQVGTTKPPIPGINTTPVSSQSKTTKPPTAHATSSSSGTTQSTNPISKPTAEGITPGTTPTSSIVYVQYKYRAEDMAAVGATLGCLLVITLVLLGLISYKYYIQRRENHSKPIHGFTNSSYQTDKEPSSDEENDMPEESAVSEKHGTVTQERQGTPPPVEKVVESSQASAAPGALEKGEENEDEIDSEKEVRSILTKDRKVDDDGYKSVWFKEDIDPEAKDDVVMIEEDSDVEQNRDGGSDIDDDVRDHNYEGNNDDNDIGQGSSDISFIPGRAWISRSDPPASQSLEDTEEHDIFL